MPNQKRSQKGELGVVHIKSGDNGISQIGGRVYYGNSGVMVYTETDKTFIPYTNINYIKFKRERRDGEWQTTK